MRTLQVVAVAAAAVAALLDLRSRSIDSHRSLIARMSLIRFPSVPCCSHVHSFTFVPCFSYAHGFTSLSSVSVPEFPSETLPRFLLPLLCAEKKSAVGEYHPKESTQ